MAEFIITFLFMIFVIIAMAVGVMFGRHRIKGSCGGASNGECACAQAEQARCEKKQRQNLRKSV